MFQRGRETRAGRWYEQETQKRLTVVVVGPSKTPGEGGLRRRELLLKGGAGGGVKRDCVRRYEAGRKIATV